MDEFWKEPLEIERSSTIDLCCSKSGRWVLVWIGGINQPPDRQSDPSLSKGFSLRVITTLASITEIISPRGLHDAMTTDVTVLPSVGDLTGAVGAGTTTTADPVAATRGFWEHIAQGRQELAAEVAASISAPLVTQFSFEEEFGTTGGSAAGTLRLQVEATTPTPVVNCWNSERAVPLTKLDADMCLATVTRVQPGARDFKACCLYKRSIKLEGEGTNCTFQTHNVDVPGSKVVRLAIDRVEAKVGVYAITFPSARAATKPAVFSAPLFWVSAWPSSLLSIGRHEMLLTIKAPPSVWRLLIESYPGEEAISEFARGATSLARAIAPPSASKERSANMALRDTMSVAETLSLKASAVKAGYSDYCAALVESTFETVYPDSIFKSSLNSKGADQGGIVFKPAFSLFKVFEGNAEHSTHAVLKAQLTANMEMHQTTIDLAFPVDQPRSAKHNAMFTSILHRGYAQANGVFNSIRPLNKLITTGGGTSKKQGWEKIA